MGAGRHPGPGCQSRHAADVKDGTSCLSPSARPGHVCAESKSLQGSAARIEYLLGAHARILEQEQKDIVVLYADLHGQLRQENGLTRAKNAGKKVSLGGVGFKKPNAVDAVVGDGLEMVGVDVKKLFRNEITFSKDAKEAQKEVENLLEKLFQGAPFKGKLVARIRRHLHVSKLRGRAAKGILKELEKEARKFGLKHLKNIGAAMVLDIGFQWTVDFVKKTAEEELDKNDRYGAFFLAADYIILQGLMDMTSPTFWYEVSKDLLHGKSWTQAVNARHEEEGDAGKQDAPRNPAPVQVLDCAIEERKRALSACKAAGPIEIRLP